MEMKHLLTPKIKHGQHVQHDQQSFKRRLMKYDLHVHVYSQSLKMTL